MIYCIAGNIYGNLIWWLGPKWTLQNIIILYLVTLNVFNLGGVDLSEMLSELKEVIIEWFMLGIYLDITPEILKIIQAEWETEEHRQLNMLIKWSDKEEPTWEKLIHALIMIKKYNVATNIAIKYRKSLISCMSHCYIVASKIYTIA